MECERACIDAGLDPVVGEQAVDGLQYGAFLAASCTDVGGFVGILMLEFIEDGMGEAEPARDVGFLRDDFRVQETVNAAAVRVSHDDDVAHVEVLHGVFDGGDDRIMFACLLDIGNDRGNASGDEEVARTAPHQNGGVDARVATGHDERLGTQAGAETLRVGSETVYPPFEFLDSNSGKYVGFDIDLIDEVAKRAGFEPQILSMGLDGLIPALMSGSIDVAVSALTITPERAAKVDFTKPYYESGLSIMARKDDASIKGVKDLENKVLCAEIGSSGSVFMSKIKGAKIRTFNSAGEAFLELNNKGCEAIVNDKPVNEYFLTQKASANLNLREVPGVLKAENYGFAIRKGDDKLRARLDKALDEIRADGTYDKIYAKWFGGNK